MNELDILKAIPPEVAKEAYSDAVSGPLREAGKIGTDFVKTVRLILFPLQYGAYLQDRLARRLSEAIARVPEERRVAPVESIAIEVADRLKYQGDESVIAEMYVSLLARAMDRERTGEAHPAFVHIVSQLAPDEALLIEQISRAQPSAYLRPPNNGHAVFKGSERASVIQASAMSDWQQQQLQTIAVRPEDLAQPSLLYTYIEHLVSLGIVSYTNAPWGRDFQNSKSNDFEFWFIELNGLGELFHRACLSDRAKQLLG